MVAGPALSPAMKRFCRRLLFAAFLVAVLPPHATATATATAAGTAAAEPLAVPARPKVGLVLSGGGSRGLAHIGVLKVLRELRVPVDVVVGTSMGAVVGGAYASGRSVEELEEFIRTADWTSILADRPPRRDLSFARREEDQIVPSRIELGATRRQGLTLPPAAAGNSALEFTLESLVPEDRAEMPISKLRLPFRALATDLLNGELIEMVDTPLFLAMRASMAVPGVFSPVRVNGRPVVDGGLVRNLGVDIARKMGAELIIAVNVGTPLLEEREITSAVGVANQMLQILTTQNVERSLRELRADDVLIDPDLANISFMDFTRREETLEIGERAARAAHERLRPLAMSGADYEAWENARLGQPPAPRNALPLASIAISGTERTNPEALRAEVDLEPGQLVSPIEVQRAAAQLYGSGDFERIDTQITDRDGKRHVTLHVDEAEWAHSRLRFGLELYSNFADSNRFSLVAMHVATWLNRWGAELRTVGRIGAARGLGTALTQPLGPGSPWYAWAGVQYESGGYDLFNEGRRSMRLASNSAVGQLAFGRRFGNWGDVRLGVGRLRASARLEIPEDPDVPPRRVSFSQRFAQWRIDTLDSLAFPTRGALLEAEWQRLTTAGAPAADHVGVLGMTAFRLGNWAGHAYGEAAHAAYGSARSLGGFLRLSGTSDNSLEGRTVGLGRLVMARRVGQMPTGVGGTVRAGFSLEVGGIVQAGQALQPSDLKLAGSGFVAVDTRFGPFYLAAGATRGGNGAVYLFLGPVW